eukprot:scaffold16982_cov91-Skeletonema_dohrnii-CCMP3373.AAC.4
MGPAVRSYSLFLLAGGRPAALLHNWHRGRGKGGISHHRSMGRVPPAESVIGAAEKQAHQSIATKGAPSGFMIALLYTLIDELPSSALPMKQSHGGVVAATVLGGQKITSVVEEAVIGE